MNWSQLWYAAARLTRLQREQPQKFFTSSVSPPQSKESFQLSAGLFTTGYNSNSEAFRAGTWDPGKHYQDVEIMALIAAALHVSPVYPVCARPALKSATRSCRHRQQPITKYFGYRVASPATVCTSSSVLKHYVRLALGVSRDDAEAVLASSIAHVGSNVV